jgi:hypothetical protein
MPRPARRAKPVAWTSGGAEAEPTEWLRPILVDYFTRDGSTLMMRLLSSSPEIAVELSYPYERKYFAYLWRWSQLLDMPEWPEAQWSQSNLASIADRRHSSAIVGPPPWYPRPLIGSVPGEPTMAQRTFELVWSEFSRRAARERVSELGKAGAGTEVKYFAEKHLNTWKVATEQLPQVQVIALLRDPRDSWISINAFNEAKGNGALGRDQAGSAERHLENFLKRQRERMRWIAEIERGGDVPVVRYDRLVTDIDSVAAELGERLGVSFDTEQVVGDRSLRARHVTANSPERSVGRWREEMDPELARIFWQELGPELSALGFSAD